MKNKYSMLYSAIIDEDLKTIKNIINGSFDKISLLKNGFSYAKNKKISQNILNFFTLELLRLDNKQKYNNEGCDFQYAIYNEEDCVKYKQLIEKALKCKSPLTEEQCAAIFNDNEVSLIVAGAGCGKTTTALGKMVYLVKSGKAQLDEILPIYFNKANRLEMNNKITSIFGNASKIAHTYNSLGLKILGKEVSPKTTESIISEIFSGFIENENNVDCIRKTRNDNILERIFDFIFKYMYSDEDRSISIFPENFDRLSIEKKIDLWADECLTLKGDRVKSAAEAVIANYLYIHKINYIYEKSFHACYPETEHRIYPDFYIPLGDTKNTKNAIWIEHWGIEFDNKGNEQVKWLNKKDEQEYLKNKRKKLDTYKAYHVRLIELFLSDFHKNTMIEKLQKQLENYGVDTHDEMTKEEKITCLKNLIIKERLSDFKKKIINCIELLKTNKYSSEDIKEIFKEAIKEKKDYQKNRIIEFYRIIWLIMKDYEKILNDENAIDFTDMLLQALPKIDETALSYKYIIIDEYQDIDKLEYEFISKIQQKTGAKICCVGDDWQAINRFKGADIHFFSEFDKYFKKAQHYLIQQTFRNGGPLINVAGKFVQKNEEQQKKKIFSDKSTFLKAVYYHEFKKNKPDKDVDRLNCLSDILCEKDKDNFLIIVRNNSDFNKYFSCFEDCTNLKEIGKILSNKLSKKIEIKTAHASKGLEADYVIVFNNAFRVTGFPSLIQDDPITSFLLPPEEEYPFAEERRLFYVALTRAKKGCYLLVPKFAPSVFFEEIKSEIGNKNIFSSDNALMAVCPWCGHEMIQKNGSTGYFYACSNLNCHFTLPKAFLIKQDENIEALINEKVSEVKRPAAIFIDSTGSYLFEKMKCTGIKNETSAESLNQEIKNRAVDIYIVLKSFERYKNFKRYLIEHGREPVCLNFNI